MKHMHAVFGNCLGTPGQITCFVDYLNEKRSQSPNLNIIENVWADLKHVVHAKLSKNISELKAFRKKMCRKLS